MVEPDIVAVVRIGAKGFRTTWDAELLVRSISVFSLMLMVEETHFPKPSKRPNIRLLLGCNKRAQTTTGATTDVTRSVKMVKLANGLQNNK
jgi:hypothetical protein